MIKWHNTYSYLFKLLKD